MADIYFAAARGVGGALKLLVLKDLRPALARDPEEPFGRWETGRS
ncbi:hypothetical protein [Nannocystis pusilla]